MTRLTEEMVFARSKQSDLRSIKKLNCWGSDLTDVSILKQMSGVEVLALSVNMISTLQPFENCTNLQELYLRKNNIRDIDEIVYLQNLPNLKNLWLADNPCCDLLGPNYRSIVLRALPKLQKLDNIEVTAEEVEDALKPNAKMDIPEEPAFQQPAPQQSQQQHQQQQQQQQQQYKQNQPSHSRENPKPIGQQSNPIITDENINESNNNNYNNIGNNTSTATTTTTASTTAITTTATNNNNSATNHSKLSTPSQRSPDTDQDSVHGGGGGFREPVPIPPSASTHSMKEYYHSDRPPHPAHYRHSQHDLTEWEEHQFHNQGNQSNYSSKRNVAADRSVEMLDRYHRNNHDYADMEDERLRIRKSDARYGDSSNISNAVLNHYSNIHRRPLNRNSNLLSATLCLVKELDYPSLEVVEHAVRCRIDELSTD